MGGRPLMSLAPGGPSPRFAARRRRAIPGALQALDQAAHRRRAGLAHIIGSFEFRGLRFAIDKRAYVTDPGSHPPCGRGPRPRRRACAAAAGDASPLRMAEIGVGCGSPGPLDAGLRELPGARKSSASTRIPTPWRSRPATPPPRELTLRLVESDLFDDWPADLPQPDLIYADPPLGRRHHALRGRPARRALPGDAARLRLPPGRADGGPRPDPAGGGPPGLDQRNLAQWRRSRARRSGRHSPRAAAGMGGPFAAAGVDISAAAWLRPGFEPAPVKTSGEIIFANAAEFRGNCAGDQRISSSSACPPPPISTLNDRKQVRPGPALRLDSRTDLGTRAHRPFCRGCCRAAASPAPAGRDARRRRGRGPQPAGAPRTGPAGHRLGCLARRAGEDSRAPADAA